ncbi:MAG: SPFH domain-containing protein, partial [Oscillospiraceae bacterium]|nr:SPFH domain-containing protein [Oscillospiraceae bacterium]
MGLLKAALAAGGSVLADQWKEFFYCDSIPAGTMMVKANKRTGKKSSNTKGSEDIITNGSVIAVADGQAMIIVDQGRVVEICAEPGEYTYDTSTEPSIFSGGLGHGIVESFKTFGKRVSFGGDTAHVQRVYYFNLKEMMDNKFGTQNPVPFRVSYPEIGRSFTAGIRCNGNYTYRIVDPILFYTNVVGNTATDYGRNSALEQQMKAELLDALQPAFAAVSDMGIRYDQIALHNREVKDELNKALAKDWREKRGLELGNITFNSATMSKEDEDRIKKYEDLAWAANPMNAGAVLTDAQAEAMKTAAGNQGGAMMGFMGMGMAQQAGGMNAQN